MVTVTTRTQNDWDDVHVNGSTDYRRHINNNDPITTDDEIPSTPTTRRGKMVLLLDVYETRQQYGYLSIGIAVLQTILLVVMMVECGVAPLKINPMVGPYPEALSYWGAKNSYFIVQDGEYWRLASPAFLHAGIFHLVGNISVQRETCDFFEREWGSALWLVIYLTSSIGAMIGSTCFMPGVLSVGSSGAIMGIFGAKISEILCRCCESRETVQGKVGHAIRRHQLVLVLGGAVIVMLFSFLPFVDWAAHLGGLLTGIAVGLIIFSCYAEYTLCRFLWFAIGVGMTCALFASTLVYMSEEVVPDERLADVCAYYQEFFDNYDCSCAGGSDD
jgi:membrane associated rhomboid family serine protease